MAILKELVRLYLTVVDPTGQWDGRCASKLTGSVHIFRSASIIWGAVGPQRFFVGNYSQLYWGFALGAVVPLVPWLLHRRFARRGRNVPALSKIVVPIILSGAIAPPGVPTNVRCC